MRPNIKYLKNNRKHMAVVKTIVSDLVTVETNLNQVLGSYLFRDFNTLPDSINKQAFHYHILCNSVDVPKDYDFRSGYYFKKDQSWYYRRTFKGLDLRFQYNVSTKTFYINSTYLKIPLELGAIMPVGKHISDIISLDLTLAGYTVIRGCAFKLNDNVIATISPSFSGKTTSILAEMQRGAQYIAEDILIIDPRAHYIYPTMALPQNYGRLVNKRLHAKTVASPTLGKQKIETLRLLSFSNVTPTLPVSDLARNYYFLNSHLFMDNRFIKAYIFAENLSNQLIDAADIFLQSNLKFTNEETMTNEDLNREHWNNLGSTYDEVWKNPAKNTINALELGLITSRLAINKPMILDVGVGTGRISSALIEAHPLCKIYGVDVAPKMIEHCRRKFKDNHQVIDLRVLDLATSEIPYKEKFNLITAIRVLKYNKNWKDIVAKLSKSISPDGKLIFTMTNKNSINRFGRYHISFERTSRKELHILMESLNLEIIEMRTFSRIPDALYNISSNKYYCAILNSSERLLNILGDSLLGRELFVITRPRKILELL